MIQKQILAFLILMEILSMNGQNINPLDDGYTPSKKSIFGQMGSSAKSNDATFDGRCSNMLKLSLTDFVRSQIRLVYERKINPNFSCTAGFSPLYGPDYLENLASSGELVESLFRQNDNGIPIATLQRFSTFKSGYTISASVKRILNEESESASFVEFGYKYEHLNYQSLIQISGVPVSYPLFDANFNNFSVSLGKVWILGWEKVHIIHEASGGVGMKFYSWDKYVLNTDPMGYSVSYDKQANQSIFNKYPIFVFRYQVGVGW